MSKNCDIINSKPRSEWLALIEEWVHDERDRALLRRRLLDNVTLEALAEEFNLSTVGTKKRVARARAQLFSHL